jgi:CBS domain-containing protein
VDISSTSIMKVFDVMSTDLVTTGVSGSLSEAARRMLNREVGCIVVTNKDSVVGIITKGDILKKAFLKGIAASKVSAKKVMTQPVYTISPDATLEEASKLMTEKGVSKLPVVKDKKLVGIITSTDVIRAEPIQVGYLQELVRARFVPHDLR